MSVPHVAEVDYTKRVVRIHTPEADSVAVYGEGDHIAVPFRAATSEIFAVLD